MGFSVPYNIGIIGGTATGGADVWELEVDLNDPSAESVSGNFNLDPDLDGTGTSEADSYTFIPISPSTYGTLSYNTTDGTFTFTVDRAAVIASGSDQTFSFIVESTSPDGPDDDTVNIQIIICVARGTNVATPDGTVPVENIKADDLVTTLDGPAKPVRWVGSRKISREELLSLPEFQPVRISVGALGNGSPERDLVVSPQHRILISGWRAEMFFGEKEILVPARALINGTTIFADEPADGIEYFHFLFEDHEIVLTEGAATESLFPGPMGIKGVPEESQVELLALFPELALESGQTARLCTRMKDATVLASVP